MPWDARWSLAPQFRLRFTVTSTLTSTSNIDLSPPVSLVLPTFHHQHSSPLLLPPQRSSSHFCPRLTLYLLPLLVNTHYSLTIFSTTLPFFLNPSSTPANIPHHYLAKSSTLVPQFIPLQSLLPLPATTFFPEQLSLLRLPTVDASRTEHVYRCRK